MTYLQRERLNLKATLEVVPSTMRTQRPTADRWSVAEIVEHLGLVETRIASLFVRHVNQARAGGLHLEDKTSSVLSTFDAARVLDRRHPVKATEAAQPRGEMNMADAWSALERSRSLLKDAILSAEGLAIGEVRAPHPALGSLNMYEWLIFVGAHEARHAAQIREVASALTDDRSQFDH